MKTIHHATLKKAAVNGLQIANDGDQFAVFKLADEGNPAAQALAVAADPKDALDLALIELTRDKAEVASKTGRAKLKAPPKANKPKKAQRIQHTKAGDDDMDFTEEDEDESKSVIKQKYKNKYRPHKMTCGDALTKQIRKEFMTLRDPDTKKPRIDWARFTKFAKANDCWDSAYAQLNKGMRRMNVVNRLRAKIKAGAEVIWSV